MRQGLSSSAPGAAAKRTTPSQAALGAIARLRWQAGSLLNPAGTARALERLWFRPPNGPPNGAALRLLERARADWALVVGHGPSRRVRVYRWGTSGPVVLLAHGWGGHAGQWHAVVDGLLAAGMRVVAFDALSHGASDAGVRGSTQTSVLEMSRSLLAAAWHAGPVHAVVSHSLGSAAAALAIREGLPVRAAVMVGPPADMHEACAGMAWQLGIGPRVLARMQRDSEQWLGMPWSAFNVPDVGRTRPCRRHWSSMTGTTARCAGKMAPRLPARGRKRSC